MSGRWTMPAIGLGLGVAMFGAAALGGQPDMGLGMLAVMGAYSAVVAVFGGRSETIGVLGGRPADERLASFDLTATAAAGTVAILVAIAGFLWSIAQGQGGTDFMVVAASGGVAYLASLAWLRWRS